MAGIPPLAQWGRMKFLVETLSNVVKLRMVSAASQFGKPFGVLLFQCLDKLLLYAHIVQAGGPGHLYT